MKVADTDASANQRTGSSYRSQYDQATMDAEWKAMWTKQFDRPELVADNGNPDFYQQAHAQLDSVTMRCGFCNADLKCIKPCWTDELAEICRGRQSD